MADFVEDPAKEAALVEALWTEKDEADCQKWRDAKVADWDAKGKMLVKYPERGDLDAWLDKQCQKTKDAALTVRSNPKVFFDMQIGDDKPGRIVMQIRKDVVPKTAQNFIELCTGKPGFGYKGCPFHRVIPGFMCQGGDITRGDGTGGDSIFGERFEDEDFAARHDRRGLLSMANAGPDTNGSQFFITTAPTPHLDGAHVVFGEVVEGLDVVERIEACGSASGELSQEVKIAKCGELK